MSAAVASQKSGDKVSGELRQHSHNYMHDMQWVLQKCPEKFTSSSKANNTTDSLTKDLEIHKTEMQDGIIIWLEWVRKPEMD